MRSKALCRKFCSIRYMLLLTIGLIVAVQVFRSIFGGASFSLSPATSISEHVESQQQHKKPEKEVIAPDFEIRIVRNDETARHKKQDQGASGRKPHGARCEYNICQQSDLKLVHSWCF